MTPPLAPSAVQASELQGPPAAAPDLILPPEVIFDRDAVRDRLWSAIGDATDERSVREACVRVLREARDAGRKAVAEAFAEAPFRAHATTHAYTYITDGVVALTFEIATERLHRMPNPTEAQRIAVMAVGGYGRGEMAPFSDVDLLFLNPYKITAWAESVIESMLYILWDLKLKVGHASRTIKDCLRLGREDFTIRTAMLESRLVTGHAPLAEELETRLREDLFKGTETEFVTAKLAERDSRHENRAASATWSNPMSKRARAVCATCNRSTGS